MKDKLPTNNRHNSRNEFVLILTVVTQMKFHFYIKLPSLKSCFMNHERREELRTIWKDKGGGKCHHPANSIIPVSYT